MTSTGPATDYELGAMGLYERMDETVTVNSLPVFKKPGIDLYMWWHGK